MSYLEFENEFKEFAEDDYLNSHSISRAFAEFGVSEEGQNRGFGFEQKGVKKQKDIVFETLHSFYEGLLKYCDLTLARKEAGLDELQALYYCNYLNKQFEDRGLPVLIDLTHYSKDSNRKLCAKQVSYIKFLVTKYSTYRVAKMYNMNQSTIHQIKRGMTWKNIAPAIVNLKPIKRINQYR